MPTTQRQIGPKAQRTARKSSPAVIYPRPVAQDEKTALSSGLPDLSKESTLARLAQSVLGTLGGATARVLQQTSADHHRMDHAQFVLELRRRDCPLESVREFQRINLSLALGMVIRLNQSRSTLGDLSIHKELSKRARLSVELLKRDLQQPIKRLGGQTTLAGWTKTQAEQVQALNIPPITSEAHLAGIRILQVGSGFGAVIQASRQLKNFGLTGALNGGAEFLNSFGGLGLQAKKLQASALEVNKSLHTPALTQQASDLVGGVMRAVAVEFEKLSVPKTDPKAASANGPQLSITSSPFKRTAYFSAGLLCTGLGFVGMALPVMPSTVFFIGAALCFAKSSQTLHNWLRSDKRIGPILNNWYAHKAISPRAKILASSGMSLGAIALLTSPAPMLAKGLGLAFLTGSAVYVLSRPSGPKKEP